MYLHNAPGMCRHEQLAVQTTPPLPPPLALLLPLSSVGLPFDISQQLWFARSSDCEEIVLFFELGHPSQQTFHTRYTVTIDATLSSVCSRVVSRFHGLKKFPTRELVPHTRGNGMTCCRAVESFFKTCPKRGAIDQVPTSHCSTAVIRNSTTCPKRGAIDQVPTVPPLRTVSFRTVKRNVSTFQRFDISTLRAFVSRPSSLISRRTWNAVPLLYAARCTLHDCFSNVELRGRGVLQDHTRATKSKAFAKTTAVETVETRST